MLAHCRTADTTELETACVKARERQMQGFTLTFEEYFPSFGIEDNWGRVYQQFPEVLLHPLRAAKYFSSTSISDIEWPTTLLMEQLVPSRKDRGIYYSMDQCRLELNAPRHELGAIVSQTLESWRPRRRFLRYRSA